MLCHDETESQIYGRDEVTMPPRRGSNIIDIAKRNKIWKIANVEVIALKRAGNYKTTDEKTKQEGLGLKLKSDKGMSLRDFRMR